MLRATSNKQHVALCPQDVARPRNLLPRNMLRWCKRGIRLIAETDARSVGDSLPSCLNSSEMSYGFSDYTEAAAV